MHAIWKEMQLKKWLIAAACVLAGCGRSAPTPQSAETAPATAPVAAMTRVAIPEYVGPYFATFAEALAALPTRPEGLTDEVPPAGNTLALQVKIKEWHAWEKQVSDWGKACGKLKIGETLRLDEVGMPVDRIQATFRSPTRSDLKICAYIIAGEQQVAFWKKQEMGWNFRLDGEVESASYVDGKVMLILKNATMFR